jgi:hypothetical protein
VAMSHTPSNTLSALTATSRCIGYSWGGACDARRSTST